MQHTGGILVIDNDAAIVDLLVEVLTDEGYIVYAAPDGPHALAAIARHLPALILLDLHMPGMSGAELLAQLRRTGLATMPILLVTAAPCDATPLLIPGAVACLPKPFNLDDLLACVARDMQPARTAEYAVALGSPSSAQVALR